MRRIALNFLITVIGLCQLVSAYAAGSESKTDEADRAEIFSVGSIRITDPWAKSSIGTHHARLFFEFRNLTDSPDLLISARSTIAEAPGQFFAVELDDQNNRQLREISGITIPAGNRSFELTEIGYFIQLNGLNKPVLMGSRVPIELTFETAGKIRFEVTARFHSPKLNRRIKEAARRGDVEALKALNPLP